MPMGNIDDVKNKLHGMVDAVKRADDVIDNTVSTYYQSKKKEAVKSEAGK